MSGFGFDPSVSVSIQRMLNQNANDDQRGNTEQQRTLSDIASAAQQRQIQQYNFQRQQQLADLVRQNAGQFSNPYAQTMAQGGFGQEAFDAQQRAWEMQQRQFELGQKILGIHRDITASRLSAAKTPEQLDDVLSSMPPDVQELYGTPGKDASTEEKSAWRDSFLKGQLSPEQQATNAIKERELQKDRFDVKDIDGIPYKVDKVTGKAFPLGGGGAPVGGDVPAPLGSKRGSQKDAMLKALAEDLDPTNGRSDLAVKANAQIAADQRLEAAINAPGPMTAQRLHEITLMTATIANGGNVPTESQVEAMYPKTLRGRGAEFWQSTTGVPMDVGAKAFVDQMRAQSTRETAVAKKQIRNYLLGRLANHPQAFQNFPNEANQMAEEAGLKGLYDGKTGRPLTRVTVRFRGKEMSIPQSRLAEALKDGAQEVK